MYYKVRKKSFKVIMITLALFITISIIECFVIVKITKDNKELKECSESALIIENNVKIELDESIIEDTISVESWTPSDEDVIALAKTLWGECRGVKSKTQKAAVAWCILNRLDSGHYGKSVLSVVSAPHQFAGYSENNPVEDSLKELAVDVLVRWHSEKMGNKNVGRVLPSNYIYFLGDGELNYFTSKWRGTEYWDWSLESPYES